MVKVHCKKGIVYLVVAIVVGRVVAAVVGALVVAAAGRLDCGGSGIWVHYGYMTYR